MRTKHKTKAAALAGLPIEEQWQAVHYGERYDSEASGFIGVIEQAIEYENDPRFKIWFQKKAWKQFLKHYRNACEKSDGSIFRKLADMIETNTHPVDPVQAAIAQIVYFRRQKNQPLPTVDETVKLLKDKGIPTNRQTVDRNFKYLKTSPSKGKSGRPRKSTKPA